VCLFSELVTVSVKNIDVIGDLLKFKSILAGGVYIEGAGEPVTGNDGERWTWSSRNSVVAPTEHLNKAKRSKDAQHRRTFTTEVE
jgi:fructose-1,6-bisphosphatase/inositol monophosphatase family enzyme